MIPSFRDRLEPEAWRRSPATRAIVVSVLGTILLTLGCVTSPDPARLAERGELEALARALENSPAPETTRAALLAALAADRMDTIEWLLEGRVDVRRVDARGRTVLHDAATLASPDGVARVIRAGAVLNARDQETGATPLLLAASADHAAGVFSLVRAGANVDLPETSGARRTPLHAAIEADARHAVRLLLQAGADAYAPNRRGDSPLALAGARGDAEIQTMFRLALAGRSAEIPPPRPVDAQATGAGGSATRFLTHKRESEDDVVYSLASPDTRVRAAATRGPSDPTNHVRATQAYGRRIAAVVGIDDYARWPDLEGARRDSKRLAAELRAQGFDEVLELYDGEATRSRILSLLGHDLVDKTTHDDLAFIYFAGHGDTLTLPDGSKQGYILPADASPNAVATTGISMATLREFSDRLSAKHVFYAMDSCYSGLGLTRGLAVVRPGESGYIDKVTSQRAVQMLTAGTEGELAIERGGEGLFTSYLIRALRGEADFDADGVVTAGEIGVFVRPQVSAASGNRQTPQFGTLDGTGEVVFPLARP